MTTPYVFPNELLEQWNGCQRNWDYSKPVLPEHVDILVNIARSAPSKNNLNLLHIQVFENSLDKMKPITKRAKGKVGTEPIKTSTLAPLTIFLASRIDRHIFLKEENLHHWNELCDRKKDEESRNEELERVMHNYAGVIAGAVSHKAIELGYKTGINSCFLKDTPLLDTEDKVVLSIGIGHGMYKYHNMRHLPQPGYKGQGPTNLKYAAPFVHYKNNEIIKDEK